MCASPMYLQKHSHYCFLSANLCIKSQIIITGVVFLYSSCVLECFCFPIFLMKFFTHAHPHIYNYIYCGEPYNLTICVFKFSFSLMIFFSGNMLLVLINFETYKFLFPLASGIAAQEDHLDFTTLQVKQVNCEFHTPSSLIYFS